MLSNAGVYAVKKRKKPVQKAKKTPAPDVVKTNPSKRHRDRLNGELDRLTGLLPFPEDVCSRLDKLSVLRLSVGYLKVKGFFKATMKKSSVLLPGVNGLNMSVMEDTRFSEGDLLLQALSGFVMVVTAEGHVFYASPTIQDYLGFHQSDVVHQSVFELIHTDDRAMFRRQLHFTLNPKPFDPEQGGEGMASSSDITRNIVTYDPEQLPPENSSFLERNFVCRFRCLLDNSSGFLALNFQGRLKFLHGQSVLGEDGKRSQPKLALFTIATPVQTPSILEIRTKTIFFQTKHKLDFTPLGVDARGKLVLGYSEIELCMRGTGYQFIHAADMMYCADNHVRMIKTGESGLTTFRLLQKTGCWVWVQANARLVYKGGRPDFIIARQRPLVNSEGEEHLRKRRLQLPFSFATGEALLYEIGPTLDATEFQTKPPKIRKVESLDPESLLGSLLQQDESIYIQPLETPLPVDQAFMDSRALTNVACNSWQASQEPNGEDNGNNPRQVKKMKMEQGGQLSAALRGLDVDTVELMEWENALLRMSQENNMTREGDISPELDDIMTNDIFSYVEDILFKESSEQSINQSKSSAMVNSNTNLFTEVLNNKLDLFTGVVNNSPNLLPGLLNNHSPMGSLTEAVSTTGAGKCSGQAGLDDNEQSGLLDSHSFVQYGLSVNCLNRQLTENVQVSLAGQNQAEPNKILNHSQRLSHYGPQVPQTDLNINTLEQLQLNDIFAPSVVLPDLGIPQSTVQNGSVAFSTLTAGSCTQTPNIHTEHARVPSNYSSPQHFPHNGQTAPVGPNWPQQISVPQSNHVTPSPGGDAWASMTPSNGFVSAQVESCHLSPSNHIQTACLQGNASPFQLQKIQQKQQWSQNHKQQQPLQTQTMTMQNGIVQNGHTFIPDVLSPATEAQSVPFTCPWPQSTNRPNQLPHLGGLAIGQPTTSSSCMFEKVPHALPNGNIQVDGARQATMVPDYQRRIADPHNQSPPEGSCYIQWGPSEPVVGTSAIIQDNASISLPSLPLVDNITSAGSILSMQQYLAGCTSDGQTQISCVPAVDSNGTFSLPPFVNGAMCFTEHNQNNYCNF
ncbi:hypothetical protein UPYG_G00314990 [Umbra pygmaea]|uniref:Aryl hydrocarbon receptor n=1 Tax=Umbra pygmaea TaxID=75934 RepID=A0ABD0W420_UMBPY